MNGECPECEASVPMDDDAQIGEILVCPDCGIELELTAVKPVVLSVAPREDEDWGE
jgi:alpha-aminoadipate carrier protein LysW